MIRKKGQRYQVRSKDGRKLLGTYRSRKEAVERLGQIEQMQNRGRPAHDPPESLKLIQEGLRMLSGHPVVVTLGKGADIPMLDEGEME